LFTLFPALKKFWLYRAGKLSGGQKQMLAIARAMIEPRRLLLIRGDPSKGSRRAIVANLSRRCAELKRTQTTVLLVEQELQRREVARRSRRGNGRRSRRAYGAMAELSRRRCLASSASRTVAGGASMSETRFDWIPLALSRACGDRVAADRQPVDLADADDGRLAMGMIIFIAAFRPDPGVGTDGTCSTSGTAVFIALGAFIGRPCSARMGDWTSCRNLWTNLGAVLPAMLVAMALAGAVGWAFEACW